MEYIKVIILSIIEGITEFLPISSTGHLILADRFFMLEPESFANAFKVIIQLGAILSVVVLNFNKLNPITKKTFSTRLLEKYEKSNIQTKIYLKFKYMDKKILAIWKRIIVGVIPAGILGLLFDDLIDKYLFRPDVVAVALVFWGLVIILIEKYYKGETKYQEISQITYKTAFLIGVFQCLALIPGTSRSAATIIGALLLGTNRLVATEFSFYLAIPTMLGATLLKVLKNLSGFTSHEWLMILLGSVLSFIVALLAIKKFVDYIKKKDFTIFGYYRIIVGLIVLGLTFLN